MTLNEWLIMADSNNELMYLPLDPAKGLYISIADKPVFFKMKAKPLGLNATSSIFEILKELLNIRGDPKQTHKLLNEMLSSEQIVVKHYKKALWVGYYDYTV